MWPLTQRISVADSPLWLTHFLFTLKAFVLNPRAAVMYIIAWGLCLAMMEGLSGFQDSQSVLFPQCNLWPDRLEMESTTHACQILKSTAGSLWNIMGHWIHWLMICGTNRKRIKPSCPLQRCVCFKRGRVGQLQTSVSVFYCRLSGPTGVCNGEHLTQWPSANAQL